MPVARSALFGQQVADVLAAREHPADLGGGNVEKRHVNIGNGRGQRGRVDGVALARINDNGIALQEPVVIAPKREMRPVVRPDKQGKRIIWKCLLQLLHRDIRIGRAGQGELKIAGLDIIQMLHSFLGAGEAHVVVHEVGLLFERIAGRHHQPHLVHQAAVPHGFGNGDMPDVNRIE